MIKYIVTLLILLSVVVSCNQNDSDRLTTIPGDNNRGKNFRKYSPLLLQFVQNQDDITSEEEDDEPADPETIDPPSNPSTCINFKKDVYRIYLYKHQTFRISGLDQDAIASYTYHINRCFKFRKILNRHMFKAKRSGVYTIVIKQPCSNISNYTFDVIL